MSLFDRFLDKLVPHDCLGCGAEGSLICAACAYGRLGAEGLEVNVEGLQIRSATAYSGLAKDLVWKLKSEGAVEAAKIMAELMAPLTPSHSLMLVAVPTATGRVRQRGYDQSRLLARELAKQRGLTKVDCLARLTQVHQVGASRDRRLNQLTDAFRVTKSSSIKGSCIMLVDDVVTTGATMKAAATVLYGAGASSVEGLTFACTTLD